MAELKDRYATSLFEMSLESGALDEHLSQALFLRDSLEKERLIEILENPHIPDADKRALLERRFGGRIPDDFMGLLLLMIEKGYESVILPTLDAYIDRGSGRRGKAMAYVVSAVALTAEQTEALRAVLSAKLGKEIEIMTSEDPDLIGGFYIHVDGKLIDQTVRASLTNLKETLQRGG
jgi:F-type H+-transporting ATPase subunit delta